MSGKYKAVRVSNYMRNIDLHQSRILEEITDEDRLESQQTVQADVQEGIYDNSDALFVIEGKEAKIAGSFPVTAILMTEKLEGHIGKRYRWTDTELSGDIQLTVRGEIEGLPLAYIKVFDSSKLKEDNYGEENMVFEFELPLNFQHDVDLSPTFYVLKGINEQYFGFLFEKNEDKQFFTNKMKQLQKVLWQNKQ